MTIRRIDILSIPVSDPLAAKRFYAEVLGFEVVRDNPMGPDQRWIQLRPPGAATSITLVTWFPSMPAGSVTGLVLDTDDLDADIALLTKRGLKLSDIRTAPWGSYATFADPDGNQWILQQAASST